MIIGAFKSEEIDKVVVQTGSVIDNDTVISNMEQDRHIQITVSQDEIEKSDYSMIGRCIEKLGQTGKIRNKLSLFLEGYKGYDSSLHKKPGIRKWMRGLIDQYPYIFYLLDPSFGINPTIIAACIGDVAEITENPNAIINDYKTTGYELVNYSNTQFKVKIPSETSNKIITGIIDYGTSIKGDPDNILSAILSIPGLNGG